jgi:hypothetical protein
MRNWKVLSLLRTFLLFLTISMWYTDDDGYPPQTFDPRVRFFHSAQETKYGLFPVSPTQFFLKSVETLRCWRVWIRLVPRVGAACNMFEMILKHMPCQHDCYIGEFLYDKHFLWLSRITTKTIIIEFVWVKTRVNQNLLVVLGLILSPLLVVSCHVNIQFF